MPVDAKTLKANGMKIKAQVQKVLGKTKNGEPLRVFFAFSPGKDKTDHLFEVDVRKRSAMLMTNITKAHKDRKQFCLGTAAPVKEGGKVVMYVRYTKKLSGAPLKMQDVFRAMGLQYAVKLESEDEFKEDNVPTLSEEEEKQASATQEGDSDDDEQPESQDDERQAAQDDDERQAAQDDDAPEEEETEEKTDATAPQKAGPKDGAKADAKTVQLRAAVTEAAKMPDEVAASIKQLRAAILQEYASEAPEVVADINKGLAQFDQVLTKFDKRLAAQLAKAYQAKDDASRKAELAKAKAIMIDTIKWVTQEPMIAEIDANPFGVQTNIRSKLKVHFDAMSKVISGA